MRCAAGEKAAKACAAVPDRVLLCYAIVPFGFFSPAGGGLALASIGDAV
jgi:hypothetical protein